jgi:Glycosyl hydrolase family 26
MRKNQNLGTSATWTRRSIALLAATSAALAATISFGTIASAAGPNGQQRRPVVMADVKRPAAAPIAPVAPAAAATGAIAQGVYVGAADPSGVASFAAATKTSVSVAAEFLPSSSGWAGMDGANGGLDWMFGGGWAKSGYTLSLGVPIIPTDSSGAPVGSLATGATGAYNSYFVSLAQTLVANGESNAFLRLGWEFDGGWFAWSATNPFAEVSYAAYFDQIVTAMRAVPGAAFRFVWNPDVAAFNDAPYNVDLAYPGNAFVNVIGLDAYDQSWVSPQTPANAWNQTLLPSLNLAHAYAAGKGEPLAFPEWGLATRADGHGLGDDPLYITNMVSWMHNPANNVAYESYFNFDVPGQVDAITDGTFPNALAAFDTALG